MKKLYLFTFLIAFILLFSVNSCKKEEKNPTPLLSKIADTHVDPEEISAWFEKMPQVKPADEMFKAAQQATFNGVQVVRIPVGYNAAIYFTKENDSLKVYAYKWIYQDKDAVKYTGYIDAYNFQTQNLNRLTYANGLLKNTLPLAHYTQQASNVSSDGKKVSTECVITVVFNAIWDWITSLFSGGGDSSSGSDFSSYMSSFGYSASDYTGYGFTSGGGSGGGASWGPPPCAPSTQGGASINLKVNEIKVNKEDPENPNGGCAVNNNVDWLNYTLYITDGIYPVQINIEDVEQLNVQSVEFDPAALDFSNADFYPVDSYTNFYGFNNTPPSEDYPDNHPVSLEIKNFNVYIWSAFKSANNTSLKNFHQTSKGLSGSDGYGKAIGAIGEGLFAQRLLSVPSLTRVRAVAGAKIRDNTNLSNIIYVDLFTEQDLPENQDGYSYVNMIYTDLNGNPQSQNLKLQRNSLTRNYGQVTINKGLVAYEVKTYNPSNTEAILFKAFTEGINQTIQRAYFKNITAAVLVFDLDSFNKLYNSSYKSRIDAILNQVSNLRNNAGEKAVFLRLENNLWTNSNSAYYSLIDKIKNL